jgi:hypothetical protein
MPDISLPHISTSEDYHGLYYVKDLGPQHLFGSLTPSKPPMIGTARPNLSVHMVPGLKSDLNNFVMTSGGLSRSSSATAEHLADTCRSRPHLPYLDLHVKPAGLPRTDKLFIVIIFNGKSDL